VGKKGGQGTQATWGNMRGSEAKIQHQKKKATARRKVKRGLNKKKNWGK